MNKDKAINKALFWYMVQDEIGNGEELNFENYMHDLWNFFGVAYNTEGINLGSLVNFEIVDERCFFDEQTGCIDRVKEYLSQLQNGNFELLDSLSDEEKDDIDQLAIFFANYYRAYVGLDKECERQLKKQAIFFFGIQLGLSGKKYENIDGPLCITSDVPYEIYHVLRGEIKKFIAYCYTRSMISGKANILEKYDFKSIIPYCCTDGKVELVGSDLWDEKVIGYLTQLKQGDCSIYGDFRASEIRKISKMSELFLKFYSKGIDFYDDVRYESKNLHRFVS